VLLVPFRAAESGKSGAANERQFFHALTFYLQHLLNKNSCSFFNHS
jgi:hypothetical protein